jgi:hypothetical protein
MNAPTQTQFAAYEQPAATSGLTPFAPAAVQSLQPVQQRSLIERNPTSAQAVGVVILYLVLASTTGIVLLGIFPVLLSVRAFQRGEQLAPVALIAAALAVTFSLSHI